MSPAVGLRRGPIHTLIEGPASEEYSRLSDPAKWRIVGARADAWLVALRAAGLAEVERNAPIRWEAPPRTVVSRADRLVPHVVGGLPLIVARSQLGPVDDAGVTLGVGDPAVVITWIPDCGCDACDSGSQDVLDELDEAIVGVVSGAFRRLAVGRPRDHRHRRRSMERVVDRSRVRPRRGRGDPGRSDRMAGGLRRPVDGE